MDVQEQRSLAERAKELECVYAVDKVLQDRTLALTAAMTKLTEVIPGGFSSPEAARVRIGLPGQSYETPGFAKARVLCRVPILLEGEAVGELAVGYAPGQPGEETPILDYEVKLMDTIALRISQLALGRQRDLALLLNILRQIDPDMLLRIGERLRVYLQHTAGEEAMALFAAFSTQKGELSGEVNTPSAVAAFDSEAFARRLIEGASVFLPQDTLLQLMNGWIEEQRILAFVKTVDRKDSTVGDILEAVRKYSGLAPGATGVEFQYSQVETWLISELTHRFLSDDELLIGQVLNHVRVPDFKAMIEHIIGSERSSGNVGGKGAGLFIAEQILRHQAKDDPLLQSIKTPRTWYIATDQIVDFLHYNNLEELNYYKYNPTFHLHITYENIVGKIKKAALPPQTVNMLRVVLEDLAGTPLIVRSSSLLEDKFRGAFSGKYKSLFLANRGSRQQRLDALTDAVLEVYASMYNPDSIQYRKERGLLNYTEQMGVLIQEVVGRPIGRYYMPLFAGVAFSTNILRWSPRIRAEDGLVRLVMGLGTRAVDRVNDDYPIMFSPGQPQLLINQSASDVRHYSPKRIDLIDMGGGGFTTVEAAGFLREMGREIPGLHRLVSVDAGDLIEEKNALFLDPAKDDMVVTFHQLLTAGDIPKKLKRMLDVLSQTLQTPVDIEFASDGEELYLLQCRPQSTGLANSSAPIPQNIPPKDVLFTANRFISDGMLTGIAYIVYVDGDAYNALPSREALMAVGEAVGALNEALPRRKYILMGPGRWGSRGDIKLGVRVTYSDISGTAALIEIAQEKHAYVPELSFGTHFFQDLVESNILYIPLYPGQAGTVFDEHFLQSSPNLLGQVAPRFAWLSEVVKVVDVPAASLGRTLSIHMNAQLDTAMAFFTRQQSPAQPEKKPLPRLSGEERMLDEPREHWEWRQYMARQIARSLDMEALGVKGVYLFGSTDTGETGMGSDIDLILHVDGDEARQTRLKLWLDGWSRALGRINFLQTGYDTEWLLDAHLVTDADIAAKDSYATRIGSLVDPATPLRLRDGG